ncbi:hypothetical protein ACIG87_28990 [Micromonospora sp. NPDC051925]|uniref:hypothetical protein n=1 Tax=Micromonospora sp. NPDC051925 TaxID=3364288 RepID=UPI0037C64B53
MKVWLFEHAESSPYRPVDSLSHARLSEIDSLDEVLAFVGGLSAADPGARFLCTLDDLGQCCYTSMHAAEDDRLHTPPGEIDFDDPRAVHAYHLACLGHVAAQLDNPQFRTNWEEVTGTLPALAADIETLAATNADASAVLDTVVYVQRLPVARDDLLLAGLPNGYFTSDWNVFQNHAVIRRMHESHGYRFFGIGASWLGFVADAPLSAESATGLVADLTDLYGDPEGASGAWRDLATHVQRSTTLLLCYTEEFG